MMGVIPHGIIFKIKETNVLIHDCLIEKLLMEDVPYGDVTTEALGITEKQGIMEFGSRFDCVVAGVAEAEALLKKLGADVVVKAPSGSLLNKKEPIMTAKASAGLLHAGWKVAQNIMEHASGIATRTHEMISKGRKINPDIVLACSRKSFPGGKTLCLNAVAAGGGIPHRLGTSETFLLFSNHASFFDDQNALFVALEKAVKLQPEKKLAVECETLEYAQRAADAGAGVIQFDKVLPDKLCVWIPTLRNEFPHVTLAAAGGVNIQTIESYAATGIDVAVTSCVYSGNPMDIEVKIRPIL